MCDDAGLTRPAAAGRLPFFVYGTLRPGGSNHRWALAGRTAAAEPVRLSDTELYEGPGFPYAVPLAPGTAGGCVHGYLIRPLPGHYPAVLADLDRLEGHVPGAADNHYERVVRWVRRADGTAQRAWVYVAAAALATTPASGPWSRTPHCPPHHGTAPCSP